MSDLYVLKQINAETTAGGLALWSTSLVEGEVRQNTTSWNAAYKPYVSAIIDSVRPHQVTEGGPILSTSQHIPAASPLLITIHSGANRYVICCHMDGSSRLITADNEYSQTPELNAEYFADLEAQYRKNGVVVPLCVLPPE